MKNIISTLTCFLMAVRLFAQDCEHYLYMQKDKTIEMTMYNKKGDITFRSVSKVSDVNTSNGVTTASVVSQGYDKTGKEMASTNMTYQCSGGVIKMQMSLNSQQTGKQDINMQITNEGGLEYPADMKVGDHLKDGTSTIGTGPSHTTVKITDRVVVAKESVTTPAGTWDCFKITYKSTVTFAMGGDNSAGKTDSASSMMAKISKLGIKMPSRSSESTIWLAPNVGMVKEENRGGTMLLTAIK